MVKRERKKEHRFLFQAWLNTRSDYDSWVIQMVEYLKTNYQENEKLSPKQVLSLAIEALTDKLNDPNIPLPPLRDGEVVKLAREERQKIDAVLQSVKTIERMLASGQLINVNQPEVKNLRRVVQEYDEDYGAQAQSLASRYTPIDVDDEEDD